MKEIKAGMLAVSLAGHDKGVLYYIVKAIENLGKTESWLMVGFNGGIPLYFKGDDAPAAFVDISVFGSSTDAQCEKMTAAVCGIIEKELGIPADRTYVKYSGTSQWGWNNMNF